MQYPKTSRTLLDKLQAGDEISWDEFFATYREIIISLGRLKGLTPEECDDLVQEVMLRFFRNSQTFVFDPGIAKFRTYFGRIIHGKIIDIIRKRPLSAPENPGICEPDEEDSECEPDQLLDAALLYEWRKLMLTEALNILRNRVEPETFAAFDAYVRQDLPVRQVSQALGIPAAKVYLAKTRCLQQLTKIIKQLNTNDSTLELRFHEL